MGDKKFRFSLDSVLKLRSHEAECARRDLAEVRQKVEQQQQVVDEAHHDLQSAVEARTTGSTGQPSLRRLEAYRQAAHDRVEKERRKLEQLKKREQEVRLLLMQRKGAEDTIRRLEEQERATFSKRMRSAETDQLDEQAISGYQRQRRAAK